MYSGLNDSLHHQSQSKQELKRIKKSYSHCLILVPCLAKTPLSLHPHLANQNPTISKEGSFSVCKRCRTTQKNFYFFYFISRFQERNQHKRLEEMLPDPVDVTWSQSEQLWNSLLWQCHTGPFCSMCQQSSAISNVLGESQFDPVLYFPRKRPTLAMNRLRNICKENMFLQRQSDWKCYCGICPKAERGHKNRLLLLGLYAYLQWLMGVRVGLPRWL